MSVGSIDTMCNARNHYEGCECGFGPPYHGRIKTVQTVHWLDEIISDEAAFVRAFTELNIDPVILNSFLRNYRITINLPKSRETIRERLNELINRLEYRVEGSKTVQIKVPLFKLHSPPLPGAQVSYTEREAVALDQGWLVKVFGIGMGKTKWMRYRYESEFISTNGDCKQILVPIDLNVKLVGVYKSGVLKGRGLRAEVKGLEDERTLRKRQIESRPESVCIEAIPKDISSPEKFILSKDRSSGFAQYTRSWRFDTARKVESTLQAFGFSIGSISHVQRELELELVFVLPNGHDYYLSSTREGLHWSMKSP